MHSSESHLKLGIDVDGVLAGFDQPFADLLSFITNTPKRLIPDPTTWEWPTQLGFTAKQESAAWDYIRAHPNWWAELERYEDADVDLRALEASGVDLYFITARRTPYAKDVTAAWLQRHYHLYYPTVILSADKGGVAKALGLDAFIDDRVSHAIDVKLTRPATRVYLRMRAHNFDAQPHVERDGIILAASFSSMVECELDRVRTTLAIPR